MKKETSKNLDQPDPIYVNIKTGSHKSDRDSEERMNVLSVIILSLQRESKHKETLYNCDHVSVTNADRKCKGATMCSDIRYRNRILSRNYGNNEVD